MDNNILNDDLEIEIEETHDDEVYVTFDIATYPSDFTLAGIVDMWEQNDITIPDFQREFVWDIKQASLLIESFMLGLPVPPVFFYIDDKNKNLVIDGQQRILSTVFFFSGYFGSENLQGKRQVFRLAGLDKKSPYYHKTFKEFDDSEKRKLNNTVLRAINIRQLSPSGESTSIYHIFERLNTGGTPLKSQEIRNVVFRGEFVNVLRELNKDENWRKILGISKLNKHQTDVELILRLFAFKNGPNVYEKPMKEFLNVTMKKNQDGKTKDVIEFENKFKETTKFIISEFGEKPFHLRGKLSTSALDSIFVTLMNNQGNILPNFKERFYQLVKDEDFIKVTTLGTTDVATVKERFNLVKKFIIR